ncbi:hypothetical protein LshimejAT787_2300060 [Lyophyllum shimeji]|uniref:Uncharacterized protein n=1 Tax=Lyophyllum shimeji TaxID=47721 RepID=A0A9P3UWT7_LYOSH|nr:hypothetical protein LshimejAT787_2300060 [Lyophyllum shimeji]
MPFEDFLSGGAPGKSNLADAGWEGIVICWKTQTSICPRYRTFVAATANDSDQHPRAPTRWKVSGYIRIGFCLNFGHHSLRSRRSKEGFIRPENDSVGAGRPPCTFFPRSAPSTGMSMLLPRALPWEYQAVRSDHASLLLVVSPVTCLLPQSGIFSAEWLASGLQRLGRSPNWESSWTVLVAFTPRLSSTQGSIISTGAEVDAVDMVRHRP